MNIFREMRLNIFSECSMLIINNYWVYMERGIRGFINIEKSTLRYKVESIALNGLYFVL